MKTISVMIPCYNEQENARPICEAVRETLRRELPEYDYEILFIDNKSQDRTRDILRELGETPYVLSTEACTVCERCAILDGLPCRMPEKMHPCVESHGINIIPTLEKCGIEFQYGQNVVTWVSLLFY